MASTKVAMGAGLVGEEAKPAIPAADLAICPVIVRKVRNAIIVGRLAT